MPGISALRSLRQEDWKFKASVGYMVRPFFFLKGRKINNILKGRGCMLYLLDLKKGLSQWTPQTLQSWKENIFNNLMTIIRKLKLDMVVHTCNPNTWEIEAGG
jgi:hypothetical protein